MYYIPFPLNEVSYCGMGKAPVSAHKTSAKDWYCSPCESGHCTLWCAPDRTSRHNRQEVAVDLKSNIFWAIASFALMASALYVDQGPVMPLMAEFSELTRESAG